MLPVLKSYVSCQSIGFPFSVCKITWRSYIRIYDCKSVSGCKLYGSSMRDTQGLRLLRLVHHFCVWNESYHNDKEYATIFWDYLNFIVPVISTN